MISDGKVALVQLTLGTTEEYDFVPAQVSVDHHQDRRREKQEVDATQTYVLVQQQQQTLPATVQTLVPAREATAPSYAIKIYTVGNFLKPHQSRMLISRNPGDVHVAEVKFQFRGSYDTTIVYYNDSGTRTRTSQTLALHQDPHEQQRFDCVINGQPHQWRPLGPSKCVFELTTNEGNKRVALFVYAEGVSRKGTELGPSSSSPGLRERKIGEVHIMPDALRVEPMVRQQTLFSAVVVVELVRRWATNLT